MEPVERLAQEAVESGIDLNVDVIPVPNLDSVYVKVDGQAAIVLNADGTNAEKTCWLAEALGHHNTGSGVLAYDTITDLKAEARARRWAHNRVLTVDAIQTAMRNATDLYDLAEALGVTVTFLKEAIDDYKSRGLWSI